MLAQLRQWISDVDALRAELLHVLVSVLTALPLTSKYLRLIMS